MGKERIFEVARHMGKAAKENASFAVVLVGSSTGVYATWEGLVSGNRIETAIGITSAIATSARVVWNFIPWRISLRKGSHDPTLR